MRRANHMKLWVYFTCILIVNPMALATKVINLYSWTDVIPQTVLSQFEQETGIHVNSNTYDSNEVMYAKLKVSKQPMYDVIYPSSFYVARMKKLGLLHPLDHKKLSNLKYIDPYFLDKKYDPRNRYSVPVGWGTTGIFYNKSQISSPPMGWNDLWEKRWRNKLLLLNDPREVFTMAMFALGYSPNDKDPTHIKQAFDKLLELAPNIKLFASENVQSILIDDDAFLGLAWSADVYKSQIENKTLRFVYPKNGFVIWVDCLAIPSNAPHLEEAYQLMNFLMRPDVAAKMALTLNSSTTNLDGKAQLPDNIKNSPLLYPSRELLRAGVFQQDVGEETIALYNAYWERLKLAL